MPYVQKDDSGAIVGAFSVSQSFATQFLPDNDAGVVAFYASMVPVPSLSFLQFQALFTPAESVAIVNSADPQIKLFLLMAAGAPSLQLNNAQVVGGVNYLVSNSIITAPRAAQILAGQPHP